MFGKKKRELKKRKELELQRQAELQARISIKKTLNEMRSQSKKLELFKKSYIEKARKAKSIGSDQTYQLAKSGLKISLSKQKFLDSMLVNFEIAMELNDMNRVIGQFVNGIKILSSEMKMLTTSFDMNQAQLAFDTAMANNLTQYEALDAFMSTAVNSFETMDSVGNGVTDDEIDALISNEVIDSESEVDQEIESKISQIKEKIINL